MNGPAQSKFNFITGCVLCEVRFSDAQTAKFKVSVYDFYTCYPIFGPPIRHAI